MQSTFHVTMLSTAQINISQMVVRFVDQRQL